MMQKSKSNELYKESRLSLDTLFKVDINFRIPIYQRNYAWGEVEVRQLLSDIFNHQDSNYYLGTIVLAKNALFYDVIDGQQRLTTLYLILLILEKSGIEYLSKKQGLYFESRSKTEEFLTAVREKHKSDEVLDLCHQFSDLKNFTTAVDTIYKYFEQDINNALDLSKKQYLIRNSLKSTIVFITTLPKKTDVNHYFEIMNNRGEQLEKHEILKAVFVAKLEISYNKERFSKIWDACSQMDNHVQYFLNNESRKALFGDNYENFPSNEQILSFLKVTDQESKENDSDVDKSIIGLSILNNFKIKANYSQEDKASQIEKFKSLIDFENFLLHALSMLDGYGNSNLEDINLLNNFGYPNVNICSLEFIIKLLQVRFLFDKYIVKREINENSKDDWVWCIKSFLNDKDTFTYNNTFKDKNENQKLVMLESMFQVTYATNTNKNWLRQLLKYLLENEGNRSLKNIYNHLFSQMKIAYSKLTSFEGHEGLKTPRAIFNFLDFLLWLVFHESSSESNQLQYNDSIKLINKVKEKFSSFKFVQRNSIEHLFPQVEVENLKMLPEEDTSELKYIAINSFGNLCLISASSNSAYNHYYPRQKKDKAAGKNESLKQQVMFAIMEEDNEWGQNQINKHHDKMLSLLNDNLKVNLPLYDQQNK